MANTLIPIQTYTLSSATSSVTFSNIPQNYTDLKLVVSARSDRSGARGYVQVTFNGATTNATQRYTIGDGSSASSSTGTNNWCMIIPGASQTANTFSNVDVYIPNYTSSNYKSFSADSVQEDNTTAAFQVMTAGLWSVGTAITSISLFHNADNSASFVSGSTFTLYGISNGVKATGGTLTVAGGYAYHTFTSTANFLPSVKITNAETLVIAGGGGAGARFGG